MNDSDKIREPERHDLKLCPYSVLLYLRYLERYRRYHAHLLFHFEELVKAIKAAHVKGLPPSHKYEDPEDSLMMLAAYAREAVEYKCLD
jgi:hypothetical protein